MAKKIWVGKFRGELFDKVGLRHKYPGQPWEAPYLRHMVPRTTDEQLPVVRRYEQGLPVARGELPEASAVYDPKRFHRKQHLSRAGSCYIVDEVLAELMSRFDIGPGGLIPYTIYEADEVTPISERWWILGLGAQKHSFLPEESSRYERIFDGKGVKNSIYIPYMETVVDDELAFSPEALKGPDLWAEAGLLNCFLYSDRLAKALTEAGFADLFGLRSARIH